MSVQTIEEYVLEVCRAVGLVYRVLVSAVGDEDTPDTALFWLAQLQQVALTGLPRFGILDTTPPSFEIGVNSLRPYLANVSEGRVGYRGEEFSVPQQEVSLAREFGTDYTTSARFGIRLGLPIAELARASTLYSTTVSASAAQNATSLRVADMTAVDALGFPLQAHVGVRSFIVFSGLTPDGLSLKVDLSSNNDGLPEAVGVGTRVHFIYDPRVRAVVGQPIESDTPVDNPVQFTYYPPLPPTWLPVADIVMKNPAHPEVAEQSAGVLAIRRTAMTYPLPDSESPFLNVADAALLASTIQSTISAVRQNADRASVTDLISALEQYTKAISDSGNMTFRQYWAARPFTRKRNYGRGVSFDDLERFTFPRNFTDAYYDLRRADLSHTFAVFRGDRYFTASAFAPLPENFNTNNNGVFFVPAGHGQSRLRRGTHTYGVSVVYPTGESPVFYAGGSTDLMNFATEITFPDVPNAEYYHVYRRANESGDLAEMRLTLAQEATSGVASANSRDLGYATNTASDITPSAGTRKIAFRVDPTADTWSGGIAFRVKKVAAFVSSQAPQMTVELRSGTDIDTSTLVTTGEVISLTSVTSTFLGYVAQFSGAGIPVSSDTDYWLVLSVDAPESLSSLGFSANTAAVGLATHDGTQWSVGTGARLAAKWLGFVDNGRAGMQVTRRGVLLTADVAKQPQRLRVFVPPVDLSDGDGLPLTGESAASDQTLIQNEMVVSVVAKNGANGVSSVFSVTVPKGASRGSQYLIGGVNDRFDRVTGVSVRPGLQANLKIDAFGALQWSPYDLITVETVP